MLAVGQDAQARAATVARAVLVPNDGEHVTMIFYAVEAEPVPSVGREQWIDLHDVVSTRNQSNDASEQQVGVGGMIVISATIVAIDPVAGDFVEVFADVRLTVRMLAAGVGEEGVEVIAVCQ